MLLKRLLLLLIIFLGMPFLMNGQVTTSSITGVVKNSTGSELPGSSIIITHTPTGTVYKTTTNKNGKFDIVNLIPGGPYSIVISYVGYTNFSESNYTLPLGENTKIDAVLNTATTTLSEVVVTGMQTGGFNARKKQALLPVLVKSKLLLYLH